MMDSTDKLVWTGHDENVKVLKLLTFNDHSWHVKSITIINLPLSCFIPDVCCGATVKYLTVWCWIRSELWRVHHWWKHIGFNCLLSTTSKNHQDVLVNLACMIKCWINTLFKCTSIGYVLSYYTCIQISSNQELNQAC